MAHNTAPAKKAPSDRVWVALCLALCALVTVIFIWRSLGEHSESNIVSRTPDGYSAIPDIAMLVFREGLECILVLAAITAGMTGSQAKYRRAVAAGTGIGLVATLITWFFAVRILDDISQKVSALNLQAATGLLAVIVLLVVMNWFFHKMYWTRWISLHNRKKRDLLEENQSQNSTRKLMFGMGLLGFSSLYREGVEVVLFLQSYRLRLGNEPVYLGVLFGSVFTGTVAALTFIAHHKLPYRKMLVLTGVLLGLVLIVMVGEQVQEMQLAHWLPTTHVHSLTGRVPAWMGLWFSIFPTIETLTGQAIALLLVLGSYFVAERSKASGH